MQLVESTFQFWLIVFACSLFWISFTLYLPSLLLYLRYRKTVFAEIRNDIEVSSKYRVSLDFLSRSTFIFLFTILSYHFTRTMFGKPGTPGLRKYFDWKTAGIFDKTMVYWHLFNLLFGGFTLALSVWIYLHPESQSVWPEFLRELLLEE